MYSRRNGIGDQWVDQDPLTISATQLRVRQLFEAALCLTSNHQQDCKCSTIKRYYGLRLFKCNRFGCKSFRTGFKSAADRTRHVRAHERPYKCDRLKCGFSQIGFSSQAGLNTHLQHHQGDKRIIFAEHSDNNNQGDMKIFLQDAVANDDTHAVLENISQVRRHAQWLILQAVQRSSCGMLELLLDTCIGIPIDKVDFLDSAISEGKVEAARILLSRGAAPVRDNKNPISRYQWQSRGVTVDMIYLFLQYNLQYNLEPYRQSYDALFKLATFLPSAIEPESEPNIIKCLDLIQPWRLEKGELSDCFKQNANRCCSIAIARFLLQSGVDVNTRGSKQRSDANTALFVASASKGQRAAEFMRFLLESGADPSLNAHKSIAIADRPGPRNIEKWLGICWDRLVQESAKVYAASLPATGEKKRSIQDDDDAN